MEPSFCSVRLSIAARLRFRNSGLTMPQICHRSFGATDIAVKGRVHRLGGIGLNPVWIQRTR